MLRAVPKGCTPTAEVRLDSEPLAQEQWRRRGGTRVNLRCCAGRQSHRQGRCRHQIDAWRQDGTGYIGRIAGAAGVMALAAVMQAQRRVGLVHVFRAVAIACAGAGGRHQGTQRIEHCRAGVRRHRAVDDQQSEQRDDRNEAAGS